MRGLRLLRNRGGHGLRVAGAREAGGADLVAVVDKLGCFLGGHNLVAQLGACDAIAHDAPSNRSRELITATTIL